jgi:ferredoxin
MNLNERRIFVCNCETTMKMDADNLYKALKKSHDVKGDAPFINSHLCRSQLKNFEAALEKGEPLLVACTQEASLFEEIADEKNSDVQFINIREMAGWSNDKASSTPKMAALLSDATKNVKPARLKTLHSDGLCVVYGKGQTAYDAAKHLNNHLSVTLILEDADDITLDAEQSFPIYRGAIEGCTGHFGDFKLSLKNHAALNPSSRGSLEFGDAKSSFKTECSLILDLSNGAPLLSGHKHRDGYKRIDAGSQAEIFKAILELQELVGEFEKPIYVQYNETICAHSRSKKIGCSKCLDHCPAGAITSNGDGVLVDANICGGCGTCHAICPTGAMDYTYPTRHDTVSRIQNLVKTFSNAGGKTPVLLIHDEQHGNPLISAMARFGKGLPAHVIPFHLHAPTSFGHVEMAASLAAGFHHVHILGNPEYQEEYEGLNQEIELMGALLDGLNLDDTSRISLHFEQDPDALESILYQMPEKSAVQTASFDPIGTKREVGRTALSLIAEASSDKPDFIPLPQGSPYGKISVNDDACTLCMACVSSCPSNALMDNPDQPQLRFVESACVQCGLCKTTCPEGAISLSAQYNLLPDSMQPKTLYEEEPFCCISCGTPFASRSVVERIKSQLGDKHWMYLGDHRTQLIEMCNDCRIETQANAEDNPMAHGERPRVRTTQDYIDAEDSGLSIDDFIIKDS